MTTMATVAVSPIGTSDYIQEDNGHNPAIVNTYTVQSGIFSRLSKSFQGFISNVKLDIVKRSNSVPSIDKKHPILYVKSLSDSNIQNGRPIQWLNSENKKSAEVELKLADFCHCLDKIRSNINSGKIEKAHKELNYLLHSSQWFTLSFMNLSVPLLLNLTKIEVLRDQIVQFIQNCLGQKFLRRNVLNIFADNLMKDDEKEHLILLVPQVFHMDLSEEETIIVVKVLNQYINKYDAVLMSIEHLLCNSVQIFDSQDIENKENRSLVCQDTFRHLREDVPLQVQIESADLLLDSVRHNYNPHFLVTCLPYLLNISKKHHSKNDIVLSCLGLHIISYITRISPSSYINKSLDTTVEYLMKSFNDDRFSVRSETAKTFEQLMTKTTPESVMPHLQNIINEPNSTLHESVLNLLSSSFLRFPRESFSIKTVGNIIASGCLSEEARVRQAAMECFATLNHIIDENEIQSILKILEELEKQPKGKGVLAAVQARLSRKSLPRVTPEGFFDFCNHKRGLCIIHETKPKGADIEWILAGSGGYPNGSYCSLESGMNSIPIPKRRLSDGKLLSLSLPAPLTLASSFKRFIGRDKRKLSASAMTLGDHWDDRNPLSIWTADQLDLRGNPTEFGNYRGVYLGKIRQGSALAQSISNDRGLSLLPSKYNGTVIGSARSNGREIGSARISSPCPRRLNPLEPLYQENSTLLVPAAGQSVSKIPPVSAQSRKGASVRRIKSSELTSSFDEETRSDEDTLNEEEEFTDSPIEDLDEDEGRKSSTNTRDSGISVVSRTGRKQSTIKTVSPNSNSSLSKPPSTTATETPSDASDLDYRNDGSSGDEVADTLHEQRRSFDHRYKLLYDQPSRKTSLPSRLPVRKPMFKAGRGYHAAKKITKTPGNYSKFQDFEYESDFESDEHEVNKPKTFSTHKSRMEELKKKKRETMRQLELKVTERDAKRAQEERLRKYKELEYRHSGTSLPITSPSHDNNLSVHANYRGRQYRRSPQISRKSTQDLRLSKSHDRNLDSIAQQNTKRSSSEELLNDKLPFSRAPTTSKVRTNKQIKPKVDSHLSLPDHSNYISKNHTGFHHRLHSTSTAFENPSITKKPSSNVKYENTLQINNYNTNKFISKSIPSTPIVHKDPPIKSAATLKPTHTKGISNSMSNFPHNASSQMFLEPSTSRTSPVSKLVSQSSRKNRNTKDGTQSPLLIRTPDESSRPIPTSRLRNSTTNDNSKPFPNPTVTFENTMRLLNKSEWASQVEGLQNLSRLSVFHSSTLVPELKDISALLLKTARNLRSQVSRTAIQCIADFFDNLKKQMEPYLDKLLALLLHKTSDTNKFLQQDSNNALDAAVENLAPSRVLPCLISEGLSHKNPLVRTTVARLIAYSVERLGPTKALSGQRDITENILSASVKLAQEGSLETRKHAKIIFQHLAKDNQFDSAMRKYVTPDSLRSIQKFLDNIYSEQRNIIDSSVNKAGRGSRFHK